MLKETKRNLINAIDRLILNYESDAEHGTDVCPLCIVFFNKTIGDDLGDGCSKSCPNQVFSENYGFPCCRRCEQFPRLDFGSKAKKDLIEYWNDVNHLVQTERPKNLFPLSEGVKENILNIAKNYR